jgi:hypothetical protein
MDDVHVATASNSVITRTTEDDVATIKEELNSIDDSCTVTSDPIATCRTHDPVIAIIAADCVCIGSTKNEVVSGSTGHFNATYRTDNHVVASTAKVYVKAIRSALHVVVALATIENVVSRAVNHDIVSSATIYSVVSAAS